MDKLTQPLAAATNAAFEDMRTLDPAREEQALAAARESFLSLPQQVQEAVRGYTGRQASLEQTHADIEKRFATYEVGAHHWTLERIREECRDLAHTLGVLVPQGRELSLCLTKLEEVMFFANAAVARAKGVRK